MLRDSGVWGLAALGILIIGIELVITSVFTLWYFKNRRND